MTLIIGAAIGMFGGSLAGLLGIGGGVLIPPLLALLLGLDQHEAQACSLAALLPPVGYPALVSYRRAGVSVPWRLVAWLILGFGGGGVLGGLLAQQVPARPLRLFFICALLILAVRIFLTADAQPPVGVKESSPRLGAWPGVLVGAVGGGVSGMFGIGGGVIILPLLTRWVRIDRLTAQVTTIAMMLAPIGLPAVAVYATAKPLPWALLAVVAAGFAVGAWLGGRFASRLAHRAAARLFALLVLVAAGMSLLKV